MNPILYPNSETSFTTRGYGAITTCTSCQVREVLNGEYELELRCFYDDPLSNYLLPRNIILVKANQTQQLQAFRIYKITRPINNVMTVYARHLSYDLSGYPVHPFSSRFGLAAVISRLNEFTGDFTISTNKEDDRRPFFIVPVYSSVRSWFGGQEGSLIDVFGGEWKYDMFECQLLETRGEDKGVRINYGVNLAAYQKERTDNVYSGVLAYYLKDINGIITRVDGTEVPTGLTAIQRTLILDVTDQYEDDTVPTTAQLTAVAQSYVTANLTALTSDVQTITVTPELIGTQNVELGDTVHVIYGGEKLDLRVVKTVWDSLAEKYTSLELGAKKTSIAQTIKSVSSSSGTSSSNIVIDTALSDTSNNPVQNRIITEAINEKAPWNLKGFRSISTGNATGTYTFSDVEPGIYLLVLGKQNASSTGYSGLYLVSMHNSSHVKAISASSAATVSSNGANNTVSITTTQTYFKLILIELLPNVVS